AHLDIALWHCARPRPVQPHAGSDAARAVDPLRSRRGRARTHSSGRVLTKTARRRFSREIAALFRRPTKDVVSKRRDPFGVRRARRHLRARLRRARPRRHLGLHQPARTRRQDPPRPRPSAPSTFTTGTVVIRNNRVEQLWPITARGAVY